jgi:type IV secretion system protein VirB4
VKNNSSAPISASKDAGTGISSFIPLSTHVHANVVRTRGGDFAVTWILSGLPFLGREDWELDSRHATFNRMLQTLRAPDYTNIAYWVHDIRRRRAMTFDGKFNNQFNQSANDKYFSALNRGKLMLNELYFTMLYRPNGGAKVSSLAKTIDAMRKEQDGDVAKTIELASNVEMGLSDYAPRRLGTYTGANKQLFSEVYEFYSFLINHTDEPVPVLGAPAWTYIATSQYAFSRGNGNFSIRSSDNVDCFGSILNIKEFSDNTYPGILNGMKYVTCEYIITHSFTPLARPEALTSLEQTKKRLISSGDRAVSQIEDLDLALDGLSSGNFLLGDYHFSVAVFGDTIDKLNDDLPKVRVELSQAGFVSAKETIASAAAVFAQLPANWEYRVRKAKVSSLNFLGMSPLHNFSTGKRDENPWGVAATVLQSTNGQPYYFNFHATKINERSFGEMALGNTMVIGKSGTGKTALVNFLLSQVQRYTPVPTIFFFDKDRGAEIFVRACNGRYFAIESGTPSGLNPFQCENTETNQMFLVNLVKTLAAKDVYTSREDAEISLAVCAILDAPSHLRTITNLRANLPNLGDDAIYARLAKWCAGGYLAWVFDNVQDKIKFDGTSIVGFDYTDLIESDEVRTPVIAYLLFRLEQLIDGRPLIFVMDEFWKILDGEGGLKEFARNKLKTIRKQNGFGIFATQSPEDALKSDISAALIEQTATLILLPNPNASRKDYMEGLKLSEAEFKEIVALDERSRTFMVKQGHSAVLCQLQLGDSPEILSVISSSTGGIAIMNDVIKKLALQKRQTNNIANSTDTELPVSDEELNAVPADEWLPHFHREREALQASKRR